VVTRTFARMQQHVLDVARILIKELAGISMSGSSRTSGITSTFPDPITREVAEPRPALGGFAAQYCRNFGGGAGRRFERKDIAFAKEDRAPIGTTQLDCRTLSAFRGPREQTSSARPATSEKCHNRTHASQQESSIRSPRRRERATRAAVAGRIAVKLFGSRPTQIRLGLEQAVRQDWYRARFDQHRMLRLR
jgi:hypothetical protein